MIAAFWTDTVPVVYFVSVPVVIFGVVLLALALARTAAANDEPLTERAARDRVRPTTAGIDVVPVSDFPGLAAFGDDLRQAAERAECARQADARMNRRALEVFDR